MRWYEDLYLSENIAGKGILFREEIESGKYRRNLYLITLAVNERDMLDIRKAAALTRVKLRDTLPMIIGMASGYDQALGLAQKIVSDCYEQTGGADIRGFLSGR